MSVNFELEFRLTFRQTQHTGTVYYSLLQRQKIPPFKMSTPWIATNSVGKGKAVGGPTKVGGSNQGNGIGYFNGPCFCSVNHDLDDPEAPYFGVVLNINMTEGSNDTKTCIANGQDKCFTKSDYTMPFCATYVNSDTFCARSYDTLTTKLPNSQDYVTALDQHAKACVEDTFDEGIVFDPANPCHKAVAYGSCNNVFPICADNAEIEATGPRGICKNDCILERQMCRTAYTSWFSLESITKFNCGGEPWVDVASDPSLLCSGSPNSDAVIAAEHGRIVGLGLLFVVLFFALFGVFTTVFLVRSRSTIARMKAQGRSKKLPLWKPKKKISKKKKS